MRYQATYIQIASPATIQHLIVIVYREQGTKTKRMLKSI